MTTSNQIATANEHLYIHETIRISVRHRQKYLQHFLKWAPISRKLYNMRLVGVWAVNGSAYRSMLLNDEEAIVIWAIPTWDDWARYEKALYSEAEAIAWRADAARAGISWEGKLLNPAADSALQTGKIV